MLRRFLERLNERVDEWLGDMFDVELGNLDGTCPLESDIEP